MKHNYWTYILVFVFAVINPLFADDSGKKQIKVSGNITDAGTKEPLSFATLYIHEAYDGSASDINGHYSLVIEPGNTIPVDGVTLNNDAAQNVYAPTSDPTIAYGATPRPTVAYGADLRSISTDRIESIEIVRGIPSVEYGNLSSGLVKIALKRGKTPLEGRVKTDLNNKLFAIGKGFLLPGDAGTLNIDLDYTNYKDDPRADEAFIAANRDNWDKASQWLFPAYITLKESNTKYIGPQIHFATWNAFILNAILALLCFFLIKRKKEKLPGSLWILLTGIAGLIALSIVSQKE